MTNPEIMKRLNDMLWSQDFSELETVKAAWAVNRNQTMPEYHALYDDRIAQGEMNLRYPPPDIVQVKGR